MFMPSDFALTGVAATVTLQDLAPVKAAMSPNLTQWMARYGNFFDEGGTIQSLWRLVAPARGMREGTLLLGHPDPTDPQWFYGCAVTAVLAQGAAAGSFAQVINPHRRVEVPNFWERYLAVGRCVFDPEHREGFLGDSERYLIKEDGARICRWCGGQPVHAGSPAPSPGQ